MSTLCYEFAMAHCHALSGRQHMLQWTKREVPEWYAK